MSETENIPEQESPREYEIRDLEFSIEAYESARAPLQRLLDHIENEKQKITTENAHMYKEQYLETIQKDESGIESEVTRQIEEIDKVLEGLEKRLKEIK